MTILQRRRKVINVYFQLTNDDVHSVYWRSLLRCFYRFKWHHSFIQWHIYRIITINYKINMKKTSLHTYTWRKMWDNVVQKLTLSTTHFNNHWSSRRCGLFRKCSFLWMWQRPCINLIRIQSLKSTSMSWIFFSNNGQIFVMFSLRYILGKDFPGRPSEPIESALSKWAESWYTQLLAHRLHTLLS